MKGWLTVLIVLVFSSATFAGEKMLPVQKDSAVAQKTAIQKDLAVAQKSPVQKGAALEVAVVGPYRAFAAACRQRRSARIAARHERIGIVIKGPFRRAVCSSDGCR